MKSGSLKDKDGFFQPLKEPSPLRRMYAQKNEKRGGRSFQNDIIIHTVRQKYRIYERMVYLL
jgi:hypothetical protein